MDKKSLLQFLLLKLSRNDRPFFSLFAKQWISMDIPSNGSQSKLLYSTDLVNTNNYYIIHSVHNSFAIKRSINVNPFTKHVGQLHPLELSRGQLWWKLLLVLAHYYTNNLLCLADCMGTGSNACINTTLSPFKWKCSIYPAELKLRENTD